MAGQRPSNDWIDEQARGFRGDGGMMLRNPVIDAMMARRSVRQYAQRVPTDEELETVVRAGQQAPFAAQLGSLLLSRNRKRNPFGAPWLFTVCVDVHRLERILEKRGWTRITSDEAILLFGVQDAAYLAQNMVIAAESLGMASCFLGAAAFQARRIAEQYGLPPRVFPLVQLTMGFPKEDSVPRPRFPLNVSLHEDRYCEPDDRVLAEAMKAMDDGYLAQDYYRKGAYRIPLEEGREETYTFDTYSWTEHMGRKWGQWLADPDDLLIPLADCGFHTKTG